MQTSRHQPVKVALVEDDPVTLDRFSLAIKGDPDLSLVGAFSCGRDALRWLEQNEPDVLLTDLGLPDLPGLAVITYCAQRYPRTDVMVITMYEDETHVIRSLEAGACGYILKDALDTELVALVHELAKGGAPMTPTIARLVLKRMQPVRSTSGRCTSDLAQSVESFNPLSERELLVLTRLAQGFSYQEIAELEGISHHTVHTHIKNVYSKLSVHSRAEAVFEAGRLGLIDAALRS